MDDKDMDRYLRRAVYGAMGMLRSDAEPGHLMAFHYAIGLLMQGNGNIQGKSIPAITLDGLDALHLAAHEMADEDLIMLGEYSTQEIALLHVACKAADELMSEEQQ